MKLFLKKLIVAIFEFVSFFVPKSKRIWLFGAWGGKLYGDNPKYLFEYLNKNKETNKLKLVWISKNNDAITKIRAKNYKAYHQNSLKGLWYAMRGKVAFCTESYGDISHFLPKRTMIVQLWHGMGFKAEKWVRPNLKNAKRTHVPKWWISTSEFYTELIGKLKGVSSEKMVLTGYPRNDNLLLSPNNENMENLKSKYDGYKFIIYMPTHRNFGADGNDYINLNELKRVDSILKKKNIIMVYKPHIHELKNFLSYENDFTNIVLAKDQNIWGDVYEYIYYFDLLISDYSSIITDFMCTGKPVVYFPYDIDNYIKGDAGLEDYFWETPGGPMGYTWDEVLGYAETLLENDTWKQEREKCRQIYHHFNDGKNCERVYKMVSGILGTNK